MNNSMLVTKRSSFPTNDLFDLYLMRDFVSLVELSQELRMKGFKGAYAFELLAHLSLASAWNRRSAVDLAYKLRTTDLLSSALNPRTVDPELLLECALWMRDRELATPIEREKLQTVYMGNLACRLEQLYRIETAYKMSLLSRDGRPLWLLAKDKAFDHTELRLRSIELQAELGEINGAAYGLRGLRTTMGGSLAWMQSAHVLYSRVPSRLKREWLVYGSKAGPRSYGAALIPGEALLVKELVGYSGSRKLDSSAPQLASAPAIHLLDWISGADDMSELDFLWSQIKSVYG